jgi:hypothetical protein
MIYFMFIFSLGTETIDMFREDYIDIWSDMPSAHFSYLLKRIIPIKILDTAAVISSQYMDKLSDGVCIIYYFLDIVYSSISIYITVLYRLQFSFFLFSDT